MTVRAQLLCIINFLQRALRPLCAGTAGLFEGDSFVGIRLDV